VTTVLSVVNKPALGPWFAKEERRHFETALLEVATRFQVITSEQLVEAVIAAVQGVKAADRERQKAATIGSAAHALLEWHTRRQLGERVGPEPVVPDAAAVAVEAWKDWGALGQLHADRGGADRVLRGVRLRGTADWVGTVNGVVTLGDYKTVVTLGDYKTGRAIYPESFLQNVAYRHAAAQQGLPTTAGPAAAQEPRRPRV
jgi:hypothetical protein